jgi:hypothetical protein
MDILSPAIDFSTLSLLDLLRARDQFHPHLMHKANVVGTAVGRYLIRKDDPDPSATDTVTDRGKKTPKPPRTLANSEVRPHSWPCILVFVSRWAKPQDFGARSEYGLVDYVPKRIYMEDGRVVPVCVVEAAPDDEVVVPTVPEKPAAAKLSGGIPIVVRVQSVDHVTSLGCLFTDGHTTYIATSRHVAGEPGTHFKGKIGGKDVSIGRVSSKQMGLRPFETLYPGFPGKHLFVNTDVALVEVEDLNAWSAAIFGLGQLGPLADLSTQNLTLNLIGCPLRAMAGVGGLLKGQIAGLFYRYESRGGREYVADFLIGPRTDDSLNTTPGDSGTVWVVDSPDVPERLMPIAIQWGGTVFDQGVEEVPYALATNLSNVCRDLQVEVVRSSSIAAFEYWGAVGHYTIGALACGIVKDSNLNALMLKNQQRVSFRPEDINKSVENIAPPQFVPLADVPDKVWKEKNSQTVHFGRNGPENPNHYADIDLATAGQKSLDEQTPTPAALEPQTWRNYYHAIGFNAVSERGLLPFRVWQIYKAMVGFVTARDIASFVCAAGVLAHYVGDACQPLHGSYLDDGDPFRHPDGTPSTTMLGHSKGFGHGVHTAYEKTMINENFGDVVNGVRNSLGNNHGMTLITGGRNAGFAIMELMRRSRARIDPMTLVNKYAALKSAGTPVSNGLWAQFGTKTIETMKDGCCVLAMLWDSAWAEGGGPALPQTLLKRFNRPTLQGIYEGQNFLKSVALGEIDQFL